jgi:hypothetical protein
MPSKADTAVARTIGIDTGKNTLHMIGLDEKGAIVLREKVSRTRIAARFVNLPPCLVGIEAGNNERCTIASGNYYSSRYVRAPVRQTDRISKDCR